MKNKPKFGLFVTGLLEDEYNKTAHLRPKFVQATNDLAKRLSEYGDVVNPGFVEYEPDAERAAQQFNEANVDLIVVVELAYQKGTVPMRAILGTKAPILVWNTQQIRHLSENADFDIIMLNSGMAGLPELTNGLRRTDRSFRMITSQVDDPQGLARIGDCATAAAVVTRLRKARVGTIGHPYDGMTDLMVDQLSLRKSVGPTCSPVESERVAAISSSLPAEKVKALAEDERRHFRTEAIAPETLDRSVRLALALEQVVREEHLDALAILEQSWLSDPRVGIVANYGAGRLMSLGVPCVPEGDVPTAVCMLLLQELTGQATILENYVMDFDHNTILLSHDGTGNPDLAATADVFVKPSIYYRGVHGFGAAYEFAYAPGEVTILSLVPLSGGEWRLIVAEGESVPMKPRPLSAPQMSFRHSSGSVEQYCDRWCVSGASHHMALAYGNLASKVNCIGETLGIEVVVV